MFISLKSKFRSLRFAVPMLLFAAEGAGGGGGDGADPTAEGAGTGTGAQKDSPGSEAVAAEATPTNPTSSTNPEKAFTQAEVNTLLKRETAKAVAAAQAVAEEARKTADLSEVDKAKKVASDLEAKVAAQSAKLRRTSILGAARDEADKLGLNFEPGALADAYALSAFDDVELDDNEEPKDVGGALKKLAEARPYLLKRDGAVKPVAPNIDATARGAGANALDTPQAKRAAGSLTRGF